MIEQAKERNPTMTLVWLGNNDALVPALIGQLALLTPVDKFATDFNRLITELNSTGTDLTVATIPYITQTPYLSSALELAVRYGMTLERFTTKVGIGRRDFVRRSALQTIDDIVRNKVPGPLPAVCSPPIYVLPPVPCVLNEADARALDQRTDAYNDIIKRETRRVNGLLVDTNQLVDVINRWGYVIGRERLTTRFLGGLFSLDGIHPTNTGYAVIANHFIDKMNLRFRLNIPRVSVEDVWKNDPLRQYATTLPASLICLLGLCDDYTNPLP